MSPVSGARAQSMFANVLREVDAVPMKSLTRKGDGGPQCAVGVGDGERFLGASARCNEHRWLYTTADRQCWPPEL